MSRLSHVSTGKLKEPARIILPGTEGIGKTSLTAASDKPIVFDINAGSGKVSVARYSFRDDPVRGHVPDSLEEIRAGIEDLRVSPHDYKTLVIDTYDDLEKLVHKFILERDKPRSKDKTPGINAYGYGKGQEIAVDEFRVLTLELDRLRLERGMTIIMPGHIRQRNFKNPNGDDYDQWVMRMDEKAAGFLREWADVVGFCSYEDVVDTSGDRAKGVYTGRRLIKFERSAVHDAKSRYALPAQIEMDINSPWAPFAKALADAQDMTADQLVAAISSELTRIGNEDTATKINVWLTTKPDVDALQRNLSRLREKQSKEAVQ